MRRKWRYLTDPTAVAYAAVGVVVAVVSHGEGEVGPRVVCGDADRGSGAFGGQVESPASAANQGLTLVHFLAQRKYILWDMLGA